MKDRTGSFERRNLPKTGISRPGLPEHRKRDSPEGDPSESSLVGSLAYQMTHLPRFEEVFRAVRRTLRQANLPWRFYIGPSSSGIDSKMPIYGMPTGMPTTRIDG